jgi:hypothetical protein
MIKVLFVSQAGTLGGAELSLLELAARMPRHGVDPICAAPAGSELHLAVRAAGMPCHSLPSTGSRLPSSPAAAVRAALELGRAFAALLAILRRERPDAVLANTTKAQLFAGAAARCAGTACIWYWRDFYDHPLLNRLLALPADLLLANSDATSRFADAQLGKSGAAQTVHVGVADRWDGACAAVRAAWRKARGYEQGTSWWPSRENCLLARASVASSSRSPRRRARTTGCVSCSRIDPPKRTRLARSASSTPMHARLA